MLAATSGANQPLSLMVAIWFLPIIVSLLLRRYSFSSVLPSITVRTPMRSFNCGAGVIVVPCAPEDAVGVAAGAGCAVAGAADAACATGAAFSTAGAAGLAAAAAASVCATAALEALACASISRAFLV